MFAPFLEAFLTGDWNVRTSRIVGTGRTNHSRIISPRMHEDILRGNDLTTTVRGFRVPFVGCQSLNGSVEFLYYSDVTTDSSCEIISTENIFVHFWGK